MEKECSIRLKRGEEKQFGPWLKAHIPRSTNDNGRGRWNEGHSMFPGHSGGSGRNLSLGYSKGKSGSDSENWRKDKRGVGHQPTNKVCHDQEVTSPLKKQNIEAQAEEGKTVAEGREGLNDRRKHLTFGVAGEGCVQKENDMDTSGGNYDSASIDVGADGNEDKEIEGNSDVPLLEKTVCEQAGNKNRNSNG